jgi:hypothetical protein
LHQDRCQMANILLRKESLGEEPYGEVGTQHLGELSLF